MTRATQGLLLGFLGAVLLRLALTDAYLRYVTGWMKWPLVASGVLLLLLAVGPVLDMRDRDSADDADDHADDHADAAGHGSHVPRATWLLLLPGLVTFMIAPPALGAYLAERRVEDSVVATPPSLPPLPAGDTVPVEIAEFVARAQLGGDTLTGRAVDLTGFVSYDDAGGWYVTRITISCCAADAVAYRVEVTSPTKPERDQWVTVTGTYVPQTGVLEGTSPPTTTATVEASAVVDTTEPVETYS